MDKTAATRIQSAVKFLRLVVAGRIDEGFEKYVDLRGKHHNFFFPKGFPALRKAMIDNHALFPDKKFEIVRAFGGGLVTVHSRLRMSADRPVMSVVHMFRFRGGKIVELWDLSQSIPADSPNKDGAF
jgi:predicted SnoaL-like aldol condensation-catalyzing enzyme